MTRQTRRAALSVLCLLVAGCDIEDKLGFSGGQYSTPGFGPPENIAGEFAGGWNSTQPPIDAGESLAITITQKGVEVSGTLDPGAGIQGDTLGIAGFGPTSFEGSYVSAVLHIRTSPRATGHWIELFAAPDPDVYFSQVRGTYEVLDAKGQPTESGSWFFGRR